MSQLLHTMSQLLLG